jgi:hypothetical protein
MSGQQKKPEGAGQSELKSWRRRRMMCAIAALTTLPSIASAWGNTSGPITVDSKGVSDLESLLNAIRVAGRNAFQRTVHDEDILKGLAESFVENATDISDMAMAIPEKIQRLIRSIPQGKLSREAVAAGFVVTVLGVVFLIPKAVFASVMIISTGVMTAYIVQAVTALTN